MKNWLHNFKPTWMQVFCILLIPVSSVLAIVLIHHDPAAVIFAYLNIFCVLIFYWEEEMKHLRSVNQSDLANPADGLHSFDSDSSMG